MPLTTAAMTILKHRTIKLLKFTLAAWDLDDTVPSTLWATSLSQFGNGRQVRLIIIYLFHSCHSFHKHMKLLASVPAAHLLVQLQIRSSVYAG